MAPNKTKPAGTAITETVTATSTETLTGGQGSDPVVIQHTGADPAVTTAAPQISGENANASSETDGQVSETVSTDTPESVTVIGEAGNVASLAVDNVSTLDLGSIEDAFAAFTKAYPKLFALSQAAEAAGLSISGVRIVAHTENRMRAGRRHVKGATDYPVTEFTPAQLEQLLDDPAFTVELI